MEQYKGTRRAYIVEAMLEYLITLLITDSFLAILISKSGVSYAATGIVTQLASLSYAAQLIAVFFKIGRGIKRFVTVMHIINQLMFVTLYMIPGLNVPSGVKATVFIVMFLGGNLVASIVSPYKQTWLNSAVPDNERGMFTANKEIISLMSGMIFTYGMGALVDYYEAIGKEQVSFNICAVTILALTLLHTVMLLVSKEPESIQKINTDHASFIQCIKGIFLNRDLLKITTIDVLWHVNLGMTVSYLGIYKIDELGFSMKFVGILSIAYSIARALFSRLFGKVADRYSWQKMLMVCFSIAGVAFLANTFTVPENGKVMFAVYYILYAVSMAGINSGLLNLAFQYVDPDKRAGALGAKTALGGFVGFLASLIGGAIVAAFKNVDNTFFGIRVFPQQFLSFLSALICILLVIYVKIVVTKLKKK